MALFAVLVASCSPFEDPGFATGVERRLEEAREFAVARIASDRDGTVDLHDALSAGYFERLRLGLGSPFRLADQALADPRLPDSLRTRVAWALLARTLDGQAYAVDPGVLESAPVLGPLFTPEVAREHARLIEATVARAGDPRAGELAVRLGYSIAAAEGTVGRRAPRVAAQLAALVRDRQVAADDVRRLLLAADGGDPLPLLRTWRAERRFRVEQPALSELPRNVEQLGIELAPQLVGTLRDVARRVAAQPAYGAVVEATPPVRPIRPLLSPAAAGLLVSHGIASPMPDQTPVVVALDVHRRELLDAPGRHTAKAARAAFAERARSEERLAAEYALLAHSGVNAVAARQAVQWAAVALRTYGQERPWFPGADAPTSRDLMERYGLADVSFDEQVPGEWRPYYRRMFADAVADLQRVIPSLDVRGLRIHFGRRLGQERTLAVHDPRTRTLYLPPATSAGTIAHEIAHDLDWQTSLRRHRVRGDYWTDRVTRQPSDQLGRTIQSLSTASLVAPVPGDRTPPLHSRRPAEVFARSVDWFAAVSLARIGFANGYLSSVQDDILTGYGTVVPPDITGTAGQALVALLDEVAPVYADTRRWFLEAYGPDRLPTAYDLVRAVLEAPLGEEHEGLEELAAGAVDSVDLSVELKAVARTRRALQAVGDARDAALEAVDGWVCRRPGAAHDQRLANARRQLVALAAGARARGLLLAQATQIAGDEGRRYVGRRLYGGAWRGAAVDEVLAEQLDQLLASARDLDEIELLSGSGSFDASELLDVCAAAWPLR